MKVFITYASEDREIAEQTELALTAAGHQVFFDRQSLPPGSDYHTKIHAEIRASDALIFLISKHSIEPGRYTLTELKFAREKWPHPQGRVFPVLLPGVPMDQVPNYLRAVTLLQPQGNTAAEILAAMDRARTSGTPASTKFAGVKRLAILAALAVVAASPWLWRYIKGSDDPSERIAKLESATRLLSDPSQEVRIAAADRLASLGSHGQQEAEKTLPILGAFLQRRAPVEPARAVPVPRSDVVAALKAIATILKAADTGRWTIQRPRFERLDLSGLELSRIYLRDVTVMDTLLDDAILTGADLSITKFVNVRLDRIKARTSNFSGAQFRGVCLEEADLEHADLRDVQTFSTDLNAAVLMGAKLAGAKFAGTRVKDADFTDADLSSADLTGAMEMLGAQVQRAASLREARLPQPVYQPGAATACSRHP